MKLTDLKNVDQLRAFVDGAQAVAFELAGNKDERYRWIQGELDTLDELLSNQRRGNPHAS